MTKARNMNTLKGLLVKNAMQQQVIELLAAASIAQAIDLMVRYKTDALLLRDELQAPVGVISKTDLAISYWRNLSPEIPVKKIMSSPVYSSNTSEMLANAVSEMMHNRVSRLFIHNQGTRDIIGVLSLSDAARVRSGSCLACTTARIKVEK